VAASRPGDHEEEAAAGTPNKTTRILKDALILAAEEAGAPEIEYNEDGHIVSIKPGPGGLHAFLVYCALNHTKAYMTLLGRAMP
jgi:hypothetical protein